METITKYDIKEISWPEKSFVTIRDKKSFQDLPAFFNKSYATIYAAIQNAGIMPVDVPLAFYYAIDEQNNETDLAAAVEVQDEVPEIPGVAKVTLPASRAITTTYYGSYENMAPAYKELENYLLEHNLKKELIIEQYFSNPDIEKDPAKWKTNVYFIVKY